MVLITFGTISCGQQKREPESPAVTTQRDSVLADAKKRREAWTQTLKDMTLTQLTERLAKESLDGLEPFNSMAYKQMVSRGEKAADSLRISITKADRSSLLGLLALRRIDMSKYRLVPDLVKGGILADALKSAKTFNAFGLPHVKWEEAGAAITESSDTVKRVLYPLLDDKRPAPMWGSEDYAEYKAYQYRVCDYAYALIRGNRQQAAPLPKDPAERDKLIQSIKR